MIIIHVAREPYTGVWSIMKALAEAQQAAGASVHLGLFLTPTWPYHEELTKGSIPYWMAPTPAVFGTAAFVFHTVFLSPLNSWIARVQRTSPGETIVLHFHNAWLSGAFVSQRIARDGIRQIVTFHGFAGQGALRVQPIRRTIHRALAGKLLKANCILTSVDAKNPIAVEELLGISRNAFHVIPNGVSIPIYQRRPFQSGLPLNVGHVGLLVEEKGWRITAEAVSLLYRSGIPVSLTIAGFGPDEGRVREWCTRHSEFARFLGSVPDAANRVIPELDVLVLPSQLEGLPMVILESMAAGVVVLATPVGGVPSLIQDGVNGILITRDSSDIAARIQQLALDQELVQAIGAEAAGTVVREFTIDKVRSRYQLLYDGVLSK